MIISVFKKNYFLQFVLLAITPILLWLPAFINPPEIVVSKRMDMPLYDFIISGFCGNSFWAVLIAFVLVLLQGVMLNFIVTHYTLSRKNSYLTAFIYMLLMSNDYRTMTLSSLLLANTFLILGLYTFLQCYNKKEGLDEIFLTTFFLAIASLIYTPSILLMLWIWIGLFNFKIYKWRSFFVSIFGFLTPFIILMVYYYLSDNTTLILNFLYDHYAILPDFNILNQPIQIVYMVYLIAFLGIPALLKTMSIRFEQKLSVRKRISTITLYFAIAIFPFVYNLTMPSMTLVFAMPLAYMLAVLFLNIKRSLYADTFIIVLIILTVVKILVNC